MNNNIRTDKIENVDKKNRTEGVLYNVKEGNDRPHGHLIEGNMKHISKQNKEEVTT